MSIHPTAIIEQGAQLDEGVTVGAYAYIGAEVSIGSGTVVQHHATVEGSTVLGRDNEIFPYAYIGAKTHDLKYNGGKPGLKIGDRNVFREYTSVHLATKDAEDTLVGSDNVILAYSHIAHDCIIGDRLVMSSHSALGGHVVVGDHVVVGWGVGGIEAEAVMLGPRFLRGQTQPAAALPRHEAVIAQSATDGQLADILEIGGEEAQHFGQVRR